VVCGMGPTETFMDYDQDLDGALCEEAFDPLELAWDASAKKSNLKDSRWIGRLKSFTREEFEEKWPGESASGQGSILGEEDFDDEVQFRTDEPMRMGSSDGRGFDPSDDQQKVRVLEYQYYTSVPVIRFRTDDGQIAYLDKKRFDAINDQRVASELKGFRGVKQNKRKYFRAFISGRNILEHEALPAEQITRDSLEDFTIQCMTGEFDRNNGIWNGLVVSMIDPQMWANKYFSQMHDILNSGIKSALWHEEGAIKNPAEFEADAAKPSSRIEFSEGALSGGKVVRPEPPRLPSGVAQLHDFAVNALPSVLGLNPELLGLAGRDQPGILESQRKQAGMTILAGLFDSLRRYRIRQGRVMLWFARNFMNDTRIARIVGDQNKQLIPAFRKPGVQRFDLNVGEAPTSPHMKERVFGMFAQMMQIAPNLAPVMLPMMIEYSPFPLEVSSKLLQQIQKSQQETPEQTALKSLQIQREMVEQEEIQSKTLLNKAKAEAEAAGIDIKETKTFQDYMGQIAEMAMKQDTEVFKARANGKSKSDA